MLLDVLSPLRYYQSILMQKLQELFLYIYHILLLVKGADLTVMGLSFRVDTFSTTKRCKFSSLLFQKSFSGLIWKDTHSNSKRVV